MAFGQVTKKPKAPTFYLKPNGNGSFAGKIGDDNVQYVTTPTGKTLLEINGGKDAGGQTIFGKQKENQWGAFLLFVIDGHFWYGKTMTTKFGETFQLKQGGVAEDSAEWKAKQAAGQASSDGGTGPAGLQAPAGMSPGVQIRPGSAVSSAAIAAPTAGTTAPKPPKPAGYKRPVAKDVSDIPF